MTTAAKGAKRASGGGEGGQSTGRLPEQMSGGARKGADTATYMGLAVAFTLILSAFVMEGGTPLELLQPTALMIILGGTSGAVLVAFPMSEVMHGIGMAKHLLVTTEYDAAEVAQDMVDFADMARREGILALEPYAQAHPHVLLQKGLQLLVDGTEPDRVEQILLQRIARQEEELHRAARVFEAAGGYSPTMGIIGTVLGLISVLSNLSNPNELGHKIALAFIATLFGILLANLLWLPFANKLKTKATDEKAVGRLIVQGLVAIQNGDSPRIMSDLLNVEVPKQPA